MHTEIALYAADIAEIGACLDAICNANMQEAPLSIFSAAGVDAAEVCPSDCSRFSALSFHLAKSENECVTAALNNAQLPYVLFLSGGSVVDGGFAGALDSAVADGKAAAVLPRFLPYDTPQHINPVTLEASFFSGFPFILQKDSFFEAGGWQHRLPFKYACVDYSLRLRSRGKHIHYLPRAEVTLAEPASAPTTDTLQEYVDNSISRLMLSYIYGGAGAHRQFFNTMQNPQHFSGVRKALLSAYMRHFFAVPALGRSKKYLGSISMCAAKDRAFNFSRGSFALQKPSKTPTISVVIRTHNRTDALRRALQSVAAQTYPAFEIVVVEDGAAKSRQMIEAEFAHLPISYYATETPVGRSKAGNLGLSEAKGEYCNFLDDDDYFYPDHLEYMAAAVSQHPEADLVLGSSVAIKQAEGVPLLLAELELIRFDRVDVFTMSQMCQIPILSVCFKRSLYESYGGLAEDMDAHEDWAMWLKFLAKAQRIHPQKVDIPRATCVFTVPPSEHEARTRIANYMAYDATLFSKEDIRFDVSLADMRAFYDGMLADIRHVEQSGQLKEFLEREENRTTPPS